MYANHTILSSPEAKILEIFLDFNKHYFAELTRVTKLTRPRTLRALRKLMKQEILEVRTEANVKYYSLKKTSSVHAVLATIEYHRASRFLAKHKTLVRALEMVKENYSAYQAMLLFGSLVKGYAAKSSDIDLMLLKETVSKDDVKKIENLVEIINGRTGLKISPYLMTLEEFKNKNNLAKQVIEQHIVIDGAELFFRMVLT